MIELPSHIQTLVDLVAWRVAETPDSCAYRAQDAATGEYVPTIWREHARRVESLVAALHSRGFGKGNVAAIMVPSSPRWSEFEEACYRLGIMVVGVETYTPPAHRQHMLDTAKATCLLVENAKLLEGLNLSNIRCVVGLSAGQGIAATYDTLLEAKATDLPPPPSASDLATMIFTSGTTGLPKGMCYTHGQIVTTLRILLETYPENGPEHRFLCWLPLPNLFQRMINRLALCSNAELYYIDHPQKIMEALPHAQPTVIAGVPRFFVKVHEGVVTAFNKPLLRNILRWTLKTSREKKRGISAIVVSIVLKKIRQPLGGKLQMLICGSAPCPAETVQFFFDIGIPLLETYAMSQNVTPNVANRFTDYRLSSVGKPLRGNEIKISSEGEILVKTAGLYVRDHAGEKPPLDAEGFYATGDMGRFDSDGFLFIEGRKNDQFKLSTGRWVVPTRVEKALRGCPEIKDIMVTGAGKKGVFTILCVDPLLLSDKGAQEKLRQALAKAGDALPPYERPIGALLLPRAFALEKGELTPNLKLKRKAVIENLAQDLTALEQAVDASTEREMILWPAS